MKERVKKGMAKVSVIIPIYNVEKYVEQCIRSVMNQTLKDIEIICVDDGSTDKSGEICDKLGKLDDRIKSVHKSNGGVVSARKKGLELANSPYVGFVDSDDWVEPNYYKDMYEAAEKNQVLLVETGIIDESMDYVVPRKIKCPEGSYTREKFMNIIAPKMIYDGDFYSYGVISPNLCNKLFKRSYLCPIMEKMNDDYCIAEDFVCVYSYLIMNPSVYILDKAYYHYRMVADSGKRKKYENMCDILKNYRCILEYFIAQISYKNSYSKQLYYFELYSLFANRMDLFDLPEKKLMPYGGITPKQKIILYGAGAVGIYIYRYLVEENNYQNVTWVDRDYNTLSQYYPVKSPEVINPEGEELIIISAMKTSAVKSIRNDLLNKGIEAERIKWIERKYIDNPQKYLLVL